MSEPIEQTFRFCPQCGAASDGKGASPFHCSACDYTFFFSPNPAVAGIISDAEGQVLFLLRQRDPGKGKFGLPGGFVDAGESVEEALRREAHEEMNLRVLRTEYLASFPNTYEYRGVIAPVTDVFYRCEVETFDTIAAEKSEVAGWHFCHPDASTLDNMAFESNRKAVEEFLRQRDLGK